MEIINDLISNNIYGNVKSISSKVFSISNNGSDELAKLLKYKQLTKYNIDGFKVYEEMVTNYNKSFSTFKYDDLSRLVELEHSTQGGRYGGKVMYSYDKNKTKKQELDTNGRIKKSTIKKLNEFGLPYEMKIYDEKDKLIGVEKFEYDENGNLLNHVKETPEQSKVMSTSYGYDDDGNKIFSKNANGIIEYRYNSRGLLCKVINNANREKYRFISAKKYDSFGHIVSMSTIKESQSDIVVKYHLTLDKVNNIIYSETNKDGKVIKAIQKHIEYY